MEEKQIIQVEVFSEIHYLTQQDFIDFTLLVTQNHFGQIKVPFKTLNNRKIHVLNIFLYYIISVQKNFKAFNDDPYGDKYRNLCTKEVSDYYIRNKFVIEEYQFAFLCSKALSIKLQESAHIIYYLIYGRFASHPYINNLCGRKQNQLKHTAFKKGKQVIDNLRLLKKRTLNHEKTQIGQQFEIFKKELKNALKSEESHVIWKKDPLNSNKENKKPEKQGQQSLYVTERKSLCRGSNFQTFIPQRISQGENSSIFQALPFHKKSYQTCTDWSKKGLMRKQKFDEFFDINDYKLKVKPKKSPSSYFEEKKQSNAKNMFVSNSDSQQMSKINYENFKSISNNLKLKNSALDKIRTECSVRNHRPTFDKPNFESQLNQTENSAKNSHSNKENHIQSQMEKEGEVSKFQIQQQQTDQEGIKLRRNFSSIDGNFLKEMNFAKSCSYAPQRNFSFVVEEETEKRGDFSINLLRSDDSGQQKENEEGKKLDYFSKNSVGFKKMNCKYKLQKYKSDYRKFMKTQLLDRIKQAS